MANEKNLIKIDSTNRARELGAKGGQKFAENLRKRKSLKENMKVLLELVPTNSRDYNKLIRAGLNAEDIDNGQLVTLALFTQAKEGNIAAIKELRALINEDDSATDLGKLEELIRGLQSE